jgi:ABC-type sugar transport system ATPase subunit
VRPEHVAIVPAGDGALHATVAHVELLGHETLVHTDVGDVRLVVRAGGMARVAPGDRVTLRVEPGRLYVFDETG